MDKMVINKDSQAFGGGVNTSSRATFGLKAQSVIASVSEAIQRIFTQLSHKPQCHSELGSESHVAKIPCQARDDKRGILPLCKALAFTLAETLIVMGIIGVVAALTIPNLNSSTADKEKVAKLQKIYSNLNDAVGRATAVYGPMEGWWTWTGTDDDYNKADKILAERLTDFLKYSKIDGYSITLADGATVDCYYTSDPSPAYPGKSYNAVLDVDLDGDNKGKNLFGYDQFEFLVIEDQVYPNETETKTNGVPAIKAGPEYYSTAWVIQMGNMDYLKTTDGKTCPNKKVLNWTTNTSCK